MGRRYKSAPMVPGLDRIFWIFGELRPFMDRTMLRLWNRENDVLCEISFPDAASALLHKSQLIEMNRENFERDCEGKFAAPDAEIPFRERAFR